MSNYYFKLKPLLGIKTISIFFGALFLTSCSSNIYVGIDKVADLDTPGIINSNIAIGVLDARATKVDDSLGASYLGKSYTLTGSHEIHTINHEDLGNHLAARLADSARKSGLSPQVVSLNSIYDVSVASRKLVDTNAPKSLLLVIHRLDIDGGYSIKVDYKFSLYAFGKSTQNFRQRTVNTQRTIVGNILSPTSSASRNIEIEIADSIQALLHSEPIMSKLEEF